MFPVSLYELLLVAPHIVYVDLVEAIRTNFLLCREATIVSPMKADTSAGAFVKSTAPLILYVSPSRP